MIAIVESGRGGPGEAGYTALIVADFDDSNPGPVASTDGVPASGLDYNFVSLAPIIHPPVSGQSSVYGATDDCTRTVSSASEASGTAG